MLRTAREATGLGDEELLAPAAPHVPVTLAELVFGVTHEGAHDVADLLDRRTRVGLVPADRALVEPLALRALCPQGLADSPLRNRSSNRRRHDRYAGDYPGGDEFGRVGGSVRGRQTEEARPMTVTDERTRTSVSSETATELDDFPALTERYQRELLAHCYRMSGSVHEAEDLVQETLIRAWKSADTFQGRSSVRTWLYRIATNVCLTNLEGRPRRPLPAGLGTEDQMAGDALELDHEIPWLEPVPDAAVLVAEKDTIRLAFIAALQHLPPRQRAVLILRDVLRWTAAETAEALETTSAAVNSALQRAHAVMADKQPEPDTVSEELSPAQKVLLDQYVDAFWRKDIDAIVGLLKHEAVWEMPPFTGWYVGAENIGKLISVQCPGGVHDMVMLPATANGQPGFALYMRSTSGDPDSDFVPFHLQVLDLEGDRVRHVAAFFEKGLFEKFGLPARLPADSLPSGARPAGAGGR